MITKVRELAFWPNYKWTSQRRKNRRLQRGLKSTPTSFRVSPKTTQKLLNQWRMKARNSSNRRLKIDKWCTQTKKLTTFRGENLYISWSKSNRMCPITNITWNCSRKASKIPLNLLSQNLNKKLKGFRKKRKSLSVNKLRKEGSRKSEERNWSLLGRILRNKNDKKPNRKLYKIYSLFW